MPASTAFDRGAFLLAILLTAISPVYASNGSHMPAEMGKGVSMRRISNENI